MPRHTKAQHDIASRTAYARTMVDHAIDNLAQAARTVMPIGVIPANVFAALAHALTNAKQAKARLEIFERNIPKKRALTK